MYLDAVIALSSGGVSFLEYKTATPNMLGQGPRMIIKKKKESNGKKKQRKIQLEQSQATNNVETRSR